MSKEKSFKETQAELQVILDRFEQSEHEDVDELLQDYEKGKALIEALQKQLADAVLTIKKAQ